MFTWAFPSSGLDLTSIVGFQLGRMLNKYKMQLLQTMREMTVHKIRPYAGTCLNTKKILEKYLVGRYLRAGFRVDL